MPCPRSGSLTATTRRNLPKRAWETPPAPRLPVRAAHLRPAGVLGSIRARHRILFVTMSRRPWDRTRTGNAREHARCPLQTQEAEKWVSTVITRLCCIHLALFLSFLCRRRQPLAVGLSRRHRRWRARYHYDYHYYCFCCCCCLRSRLSRMNYAIYVVSIFTTLYVSSLQLYGMCARAR